MRIKGLITITAILWGMMFSLPLLHGEATFKKSAFNFTEHNRLFIEKVICGYKFKIPQTFDECNGYRLIKVPSYKCCSKDKVCPIKYDGKYKVEYNFSCYDFSEKSRLLSITDINGKQLLMVGDKIIKDER
jgi:hypothetical protein